MANVARPRAGEVKRGSEAEHRLRYAWRPNPKPLVRPRPCPYRGVMAMGWRAYFAGKPQPHGDGSYGKMHAFAKGWIHAKLAHEQGKPAL